MRLKIAERSLLFLTLFCACFLIYSAYLRTSSELFGPFKFAAEKFQTTDRHENQPIESIKSLALQNNHDDEYADPSGPVEAIDVKKIDHDKDEENDDEPTSNLETILLKDLPNKRIKKILVIAYARTGSSFFGDFLQHSWPSWFIYEPMWVYRTTPPRHSSEKTKEIFDMLVNQANCNYTNGMPLSKAFVKKNWIMHKNVDRFKMYDNRPRDNNYYYLNATMNNYICRQCNHVIAKTIRMGIGNLSYVFERIKENVSDWQVVWLIRDPRSIFASRKKLSWCGPDRFCYNMSITCQNMEDDIREIEILRKTKKVPITVLRYEDFIIDYQGFGKKVFDRLKLNYTTRVTKFLKVKEKMMIPCGTPKREENVVFKKQLLKWTSNLKLSEVDYIQSVCGRAMQQLGYKPVDLTKALKAGKPSTIANQTLKVNAEKMLDDNFIFKDLSP